MSLHLFSFKEAIAQNYRSAIPQYYRIGVNTTYDVLVLRMLTSVIRIYNKRLGKEVILNTNYTSFPSHQVTRKSTKQIKTLFQPFTLKDYSSVGSPLIRYG